MTSAAVPRGLAELFALLRATVQGDGGRETILEGRKSRSEPPDELGGVDPLWPISLELHFHELAAG
jgi:hypothetical protein